MTAFLLNSVGSKQHVPTYMSTTNFRRFVRHEDGEFGGTTETFRKERHTQRIVFFGCPSNLRVMTPNNLLSGIQIWRYRQSLKRSLHVVANIQNTK